MDGLHYDISIFSCAKIVNSNAFNVLNKDLLKTGSIKKILLVNK